MCVFSCSVLLVEIVDIDTEKEKDTTGDEEKGEENSTTGQEEGDDHNKTGEDKGNEDTTTKKNGMTLFISINFNNLHAFVRDSAFLH